MLIEMTLVAAAVVAVPPVYPHVGYRVGDQRRIATIAPYPSGRADDVHRPGFNGKLWIGEAHVGPRNTDWPLGWGDPGPAAYGALDDQFARVYARVGHVVVGVSPWIELPRQQLGRFEAARQEWLKERGYVGGVRTFVNDAHLAAWRGGHPSAVAAPVDDELITMHSTMNKLGSGGEARKITPRATFQKPDDVVKIKGRQRVNAEQGQGAHESGVVVKVVSSGAVMRRDANAGRGGASSVPFAVRPSATIGTIARDDTSKATDDRGVAADAVRVERSNSIDQVEAGADKNVRRADASKF
jgi:hypothetical protein